ncbi:hypothetical protein JOF48_003601 [Arthrobacter stackebrandtii]|uniref:Uncharacterized protein n=1 Tax=Arthrobacter stackebrandtii TaxID=272161 RepID=A0ABS4Z175_9MICC|nr:hypothetical protein [Arthrobacter stackebrandtii]MBP2414802.1 hypothetical protein [Arthrobacter stackebrandtii]PYG99461.1 hypothetical protein CVV67_15205 [Arthrobacter stackebrandtii]
MAQSPAPVITALATSPPQWWEVLGALGPLAVLLGAGAAAVLGAFTLRQRTRADALALAQKREADERALEQKRRADDRSEWWRRAEWALDRALDGRPATRAVGLSTLQVLARSTLARAEELELFDTAWASVSDPHSGSGGRDNEEPVRPVQALQPSPGERRVQIAAARLQVTLDDRLGRTTPEQVRALAGEAF